MIKKNVENLVCGDMVDMASCPYLHKHPTAEFQFAEVEAVKRETPKCVAVTYSDIDTIRYPIGTVLTVR